MRLLIFFLFLIITSLVHAQNAYRFRNYTISDGLSQSAISTLIQDNIGSIWIGTQDGLNRFDGQTFETFTPDNSVGIENGDFLSAIKSEDGTLWFGTSNGLTKYDPSTEIFKTYLAPNLDVLQAKSIVEDQKGNIWIGSYNAGILLFNAKTKKINKIKEAKLPTEKIHYTYLSRRIINKHGG
jgi:ligand-binding sensor domain-containing protein